MSRARITWLIAAVLCLAAVAGTAFHEALISALVGPAISLVTGYHVRYATLHVGGGHLAATEVSVAHGSETILAAPRVDVDYRWRDIFPGGSHRFGFASFALTRPQITIVHHKDGSYNLPFAPTSSAPSTATRSAAAPLFFTARVRGGSFSLIDPYRADPLARRLDLTGIAVDASVKSDERTHYTLRGDFISGPDRRYPIALVGTIDFAREFAMHRLTAAVLPLRTPLDYAIDSRDVRVHGGIARHVDARYYALGVKADAPVIYHVGAHADLEGVTVSVPSFAVPLRDIAGPVDAYDRGITSSGVRASLAGVPVTAAGGLYDFADPMFRLGVSGTGDLTRLRAAFAFSQHEDIAGMTHVGALVEFRPGDPLVVLHVASDRLRYRDFPLNGLTGMGAYYDSALTLADVSAGYGPLNLGLGGTLAFGKHLDSRLVVHSWGPAASVPYFAQLLPQGSIDVLAILSGRDLLFDAGGTVAGSGGGRAAGFFALDSKGRGEVGPLEVLRDDGGQLYGGFRLDRSTSQAAGWAWARDFRLGANEAPPLPGLALPVLPAYSGVLDGDIAGFGPPSNFVVAGSARADGVRLSTIDVTRGQATFAGTFDDMRLGAVDASGPWGSLVGEAALAGGAVAIRGNYHGSFGALQAFTGDLGAHGAVDGPVSVISGNDRVTVQTTGLTLGDADVQGVKLDQLSGTIGLRGKAIETVTAQARSRAGGAVVLGDGPGRVTLSTDALPVAALRGTGVPLSRGRVAVAGTALLGGPSVAFEGTVAVDDGRYQRFPVWGNSALAYAGATATFAGGVGALGTNVARFGGSVSNLNRSHDPSYALKARVGLGSVEDAVLTLGLPVKYLYGSYDADLAVSGAGNTPRLTGTVRLPEGQYNGLDFRNGRTSVLVDPHHLQAIKGAVTVGSTYARFGVRVFPDDVGIGVRADRANLADFNDYFDAGDTLAGRGKVYARFRSTGGKIRTYADIDVAALRYKRIVIGDTRADWVNTNNTIKGEVAIAGQGGTLRVGGTVALQKDRLGPALSHAFYDVHARLRNFDLKTWVPALADTVPHFPVLPVLGVIDADGQARGEFPQLGLNVSASLRDGAFGKIPIQKLSLAARANNGRTEITQANLDVGFLQATGKGSFGLGVAAPLNLSVAVTSTELGQLVQRSTGIVADLGGSLTSNVLVSGTRVRPSIRGGFDLENARLAGLTIPRIVGTAAVKGKSFQLSDAEVVLPHGSFDVAGTLPLTLNPFGIGPAGAPLAFDVEARNVQLADFGPLFPAGTKIAGTIGGRFGVGGSMDAPNLLGALNLTGGSFQSPLERAPISGATARLDFNGTTAELAQAHVNVGGGTIDGSGRVVFPRPGSQAPLAYRFDAVAAGARLDVPAYGRGRVDGSISLLSGAPRPVLGGDLTFTDTSIPFAALYNPASGTSSGPPPLDLGLNLRVNAGRNVRVQKGGAIDIGATGAVNVAGTLADPKLSGVFDATGGTLTYFNRVFRVDTGTVSFEPSSGVVPYLDAVGTTRVANPDPDPARNPTGNAEISVAVTGPASNLSVALSSQPNYSRSQILGLLVNASALGAVNFDTSGSSTATLRGAPAEGTGALPSGILVQNGDTGQVRLSQEAFSLVNAQFLSNLLAPLETGLGGALGLNNLAFTLDGGGGVGVNARKLLGRNLYLVYGQTFTYPVRQTFGIQARPNDSTSFQLTVFTQQATTFGANLAGQRASSNYRATGNDPASGTSGISFSLQKLYK